MSEMHEKIRLRTSDIEQIIESFKNHFGENDKLWIFGSRVDVAKRGGDIDLYVETSMLMDDAIKKEMRFVGDLWNRIGEQKIDVVVRLIHSNYHLPIYDVAQDEGVRLI